VEGIKLQDWWFSWWRGHFVSLISLLLFTLSSPPVLPDVLDSEKLGCSCEGFLPGKPALKEFRSGALFFGTGGIFIP